MIYFNKYKILKLYFIDWLVIYVYCDICSVKDIHKKTDKNDFHKNNKYLMCMYKYQNDKSAKEKLILNNVNLVRKIAFKKSKISSLTYDDLVQEGILGLIRGIDKFDTSKGTEFSTYVYYWINQYIDRAIYDRGFLIRLPIHIIEKINKINKLQKNQLLNIGYIDKKQICKELKISCKEYEELKKYELKIKKISSLNQNINSEEGNNDDSQLEDIIPYSGNLSYCDLEDDNIEDEVYKKFLRKDIERVLNTLSPREENIIRQRFGLYEKEPKTLEEIGEDYKLTRERIRQIEEAAIRKLRHASRSIYLRDYVI